MYEHVNAVHVYVKHGKINEKKTVYFLSSGKVAMSIWNWQKNHIVLTKIGKLVLLFCYHML